jgi:hypothetical protein
MIVFDLTCEHAHRFEAWFGSTADYEQQKAHGLIACPLCDSPNVEKAPTAAAVPAKSNRQSPAATALALQRQLEAQSEWVGDRFAEKARALHASGDPSAVHGEASLADARALVEEGIPILPLPFRPLAKSNA